MADETYPVLSEHPLAAAARKRWRGVRREPGELPRILPGTVLVFDVDGRFETVRRTHLTGAEMPVANAVAVSVVSTREKTIRVDLSVPSRSPADEFLISVTFHCQVDRPDVVAAAGLTDLVTPLREHLGRASELFHRCARFGVEDIAEVRAQATAAIAAFCRTRPPQIDGMLIDLGGVLVYTPATLQAHAAALRDEERDQETQTLRRRGERANIEYQAEVLRDAEQATATAVARGDMRADEVVDRLFKERDERRGQLLELMNSLSASGRLDRVPIDEKYLVDALTKDLTGGLPADDDRTSIPAAPRRGIGVGTAEDADEPMDYVHEDELADE